jgi:L-alanine-DL-glutamate epimerase-like enolase superfamily enzyme
VVARASAVHVAASLPGADWASGLGVGELFEDLDEGPYAPEQGRITVPPLPGLGLGGRERWA